MTAQGSASGGADGGGADEDSLDVSSSTLLLFGRSGNCSPCSPCCSVGCGRRRSRRRRCEEGEHVHEHRPLRQARRRRSKEGVIKTLRCSLGQFCPDPRRQLFGACGVREIVIDGPGLMSNA